MTNVFKVKRKCRAYEESILMKKITYLLICFVVLAVLATSLAGCQGKSTTENDKAGEADTTAVSSTSAAPEKKDFTFSVFNYLDVEEAECFKDPNESVVMQEYIKAYEKAAGKNNVKLSDRNPGYSKEYINAHAFIKRLS